MKIHDIKIDTTIMGNEIRHTIKDEITQHMSGTIIRTQDENTIKALKQLGWTPPDESVRLREALTRIANLSPNFTAAREIAEEALK